MSSPVMAPAEDLVMIEFVAYRQQHRRVQLSLADKSADYS
jgi:hypothetical protein